jgi:hypothetical protein
MAKALERTRPFKSEASRPATGLAVIFDLTGFSKFFNQPDVHTYIPRYLNHVTKCVETCFWGGNDFWLDNQSDQKAKAPDALRLLPIHRKFLGDGALYIWNLTTGSAEGSAPFVKFLINRLWNLQSSFNLVNNSCSDDIPVTDLPKSIRFGVAKGTIHELSVKGRQNKEYIGFCINLAARLQKYCDGLNFLASARIDLSSSVLKRSGYKKVVATKIKGFPQEIVIVDEIEYKALDADIRKGLFKEIGNHS